MPPETEGGGERILVVEDDPSYRSYLELRLRRDGHETRVVPDGTAALEALEEYRPTILITDLLMPGMDGLELSRRVRSRSDCENLPILVLSSADESSAIGEVVGLGLIWYLRKGAAWESFRRTLRNLIARSQTLPEVS